MGPRGARGGRRAEPAGAGRAAAAAVPERARGRAGRRMELNSLLILLEAAEYLERRDRGSARAPLCAGPRGWLAGGGAGAGPADRAVCLQRPSMATPRSCPSTATSPGRKQRLPAWCARLRTTGTAPPARGGPGPLTPGCPPGPRPPGPPPPRAPAASLEEEARPGRGRSPSPARPAPPAPSPSSCGPRLLGLSRKQCHAYSPAARPGSPPVAALRPQVVTDFFAQEKKLSVGVGRCPLGPGKLRLGAEQRGAGRPDLCSPRWIGRISHCRREPRVPPSAP